MKKSRFSDSKMIAILKQAEAGSAVPGLCREHGVSSAPFYKWRSKFGGMDASMVSWMKELEEVRPSQRREMARAAVSGGRTSIRWR